jgi:hypothetical protein
VESKKNLVKEDLNQQKMARDVDFRAPAGRESLWTTDKKVEFSYGHCEHEVRKPPISSPISNFAF